MSVLGDLVSAVADGSIEIVDLTAPLSAATPVIQLPPPFANTKPFALHEISRYDNRGPAWYWNDISTGEQVGTHFDAPVHWVTGRERIDVSRVPVRHLVAPAVVIDKSRECASDPDFLLTVAHVEAWVKVHGPLPDGGWLLYRSGWDSRAQDASRFLNANETGRTHQALRLSARGGWRTRPRSSASGSRPWAPTPEPRTASIPRFRATHSCSGPGSMG